MDGSQSAEEVGKVKGEVVIDSQDLRPEEIDEAFQVSGQLLFNDGDGFTRHRPLGCISNGDHQVEEII